MVVVASENTSETPIDLGEVKSHSQKILPQKDIALRVSFSPTLFTSSIVEINSVFYLLNAIGDVLTTQHYIDFSK